MMEPAKEHERSGHIPGATHLYYEQSFNVADGSFKSFEELHPVYSSHGATPRYRDDHLLCHRRAICSHLVCSDAVTRLPFRSRVTTDAVESVGQSDGYADRKVKADRQRGSSHEIVYVPESHPIPPEYAYTWPKKPLVAKKFLSSR